MMKIFFTEVNFDESIKAAFDSGRRLLFTCNIGGQNGVCFDYRCFNGMVVLVGKDLQKNYCGWIYRSLCNMEHTFAACIMGGGADNFFLPVDSTYSASNIGALGILNLIFLLFFGSGCIIAFLIDLGRVVISVKNEKQEK